jgi:uncharacterized protein (TIGR03032 family)
MSQPPPPFSCTYSPNVPELLQALGISLALSTYQAGKVVLISAQDDETLVQLPRTFDTAMGIAVAPGRMAIAAKNEVVVLGASPGLAVGYPGHPGIYDTLYAPRAAYYTGQLALHDMAWTKNGLLAVNTLFSCLSIIDDTCSFRPVWQPPCISRLVPEDRCHLNGMALSPEGNPEFVTALGVTDTRQGWREDKMTGGVLLRVPSGETVLGGLPMPHSPRLYGGQLYALLSAAGELVRVDPAAGTCETLVELPGFARGMDRCGDYLFIGLSKLRHKSSVFGDLPIAKRSPFAGIVIVYLPRPSIVGHVRYEASVEEIYDVRVLPGVRRPGIMNTAKDTFRAALVTPTDTYWAKDTPSDSVFADEKKKPDATPVASRPHPPPNQSAVQFHGGLRSSQPSTTAGDRRPPPICSGEATSASGTPVSRPASPPSSHANGHVGVPSPRPALQLVPVVGLPPEDWERRWSNLLFPHFRQRMRRQDLPGERVGIVARDTDAAHALIVGLIRPDGQSAEIMSLVVAPPWRRQGVATALLARAGALLRQRGVHHLDAVWHSNWEFTPALDALLRRDGWREPQHRMIMHRCSLKFPWIEREYRLPPGYELFPWSDLRPDEAAELRERDRRGEFTTFLTPFQCEDRILPQISRGIRQDGRVVGWFTVHEQGRESVQCSCLFVYPDHRDPHLAQAMMADAARALRATGKPYFTYQVEAKNERVIAFLRRRFAPHGALLAETWIMASRKELG